MAASCFTLPNMELEGEDLIRVGPAGWSYKDWEGIVFPSPLPRGFHGAEYLSEFFDTIEVNNTFYRPPSPETGRSWANRVSNNRNFRYTAKLWRGFTHERNATRADEHEFRAGIDPLIESNRLGALLLQFPISFQNTKPSRQYLLDLHRRFSDYPLVLEVRHNSWNDPHVLDTLSEWGIGFCNIDQPLLGRGVPPSAEVTSPTGYVRLHGRNYKEWFAQNRKPSDRYNYLYRMEQLEPWADRARSISERTHSTYVVTNNHFEGKAVVNALQLSALLTGKPVRVPEQLERRYPELRDLSAT